MARAVQTARDRGAPSLGVRRGGPPRGCASSGSASHAGTPAGARSVPGRRSLPVARAATRGVEGAESGPRRTTGWPGARRARGRPAPGRGRPRCVGHGGAIGIAVPACLLNPTRFPRASRPMPNTGSGRAGQARRRRDGARCAGCGDLAEPQQGKACLSHVTIPPVSKSEKKPRAEGQGCPRRSAACPRPAAGAAPSGCSRRARCPRGTRSRSASWSGRRQEGHEEEARQGRLSRAPRPHPRIGSMPAPRFVEQLNLQIGNELAAHNQYLAVAVHYDAQTMPRMAAFFYAQALEERDHAMMMVQYLLDTDAEVVIPGVEAPVSKFDDVVAPGRAGPRPGEAGHRADQHPAPDRPRGVRLRLRAVHAVVHQGAGRGGRHDERPARRGRPATATTSRTSRSTSPASRAARDDDPTAPRIAGA